jgi:hypothetical protein
MNGVICSSLAVDFSAPAGSSPPVYCTVLLRNRSKTTADLDRMILYAEELSIYESGGKLYSDTPVIDIFGSGDFKASVKAFHREHKKLVTAGTKNSMGLIRHGTRIIIDIASRS